MLKSFLIVMAMGLLSLQMACTFGDGTVEGCSTVMSGTYEGDQEGLIFGYVNIDGNIALTMVIEDDTPDDLEDNTKYTATLLIDSEGAVTTEAIIALEVLNASMDLDSCVVSGEWDLFFGMTTGTFAIGPYNPI